VAVGSGKGGVGKSTLTLHLAGALRARGLRIAILDADFNGPSQARMAACRGAVRSRQPEGRAPADQQRDRRLLDGLADPGVGGARFESAAQGESHTWRATREFALLGEILGPSSGGARSAAVRSAAGAERTVQYADFLGRARRSCS
jgi:ATP-binding protein involved in chromosome partitioning